MYTIIETAIFEKYAADAWAVDELLESAFKLTASLQAKANN